MAVENDDNGSAEEMEELEKKKAAASWKASSGSDVSTGGGAYIGRDYAIQSDEIYGDKITGDKAGRDKIAFDEILSSPAVFTGGSEIDGAEQELVAVGFDTLFTPLSGVIAVAPEDVRQEALYMADALREEVAKGGQADDAKIAKLIQQLSSAVPDAARVIKEIFNEPLLANLNGPVTSFVLDNLRAD